MSQLEDGKVAVEKRFTSWAVPQGNNENEIIAQTSVHAPHHFVWKDFYVFVIFAIRSSSLNTMRTYVTVTTFK